MEAVLKFIAGKFNMNVLVLFIISGLLLLLLDCKQYKTEKLKKEYKFSKFFGIFYICFGIVMFIFAKLIRV